MTTRLPEWYEFKEATTWNYFKIKEEAQSFRILTSPIVWYEYFKESADWKVKPVRQKQPFTWTPEDSSKWQAPKEFWAFVIYNHTEKRIQIMELTQRTLMKTIVDLSKSKDWWDPKMYDFEVSRTWKGTDTKYTLTPLPKSRFENDSEWNNALKEAEEVKLEELFDGGDPFNPNPY